MSKREEGYNISDTGNWNVAAEYSKIKIMRPLEHIDHYENIAKFGSDTILEQLENYGQNLDLTKITGFERLVNEMIKLINNSLFALKKAQTRKTMEDLKKKLNKIKEIIPSLYEKKTNHRNRTSHIQLNKNYKIVLEEVLEIKSQINEPLNANHLIFTDKEEFDPKEYKRKIIEEATTRG